MVNDFGCRHSTLLQQFFDIENVGIDYITRNGVHVEFKESWAKDLENMFFKVPKRQLENSDLIVFCVYNKEFFVHTSNHILLKYGFKNKYERCCLRYNTVRRNYVAKFSQYEDLQTYLERIK